MWALTKRCSPFLGLAMGCYITLSLFFLMNLVCGVLVDRITKPVREDKDEHLANNISEIFSEKDVNGIEKKVTMEDFAAKLNTETVQAYFQSVDVRPDFSAAKGLFELIDLDGSGSVSTGAIVN